MSNMLKEGIGICDKQIITWGFGYRPQYQPLLHIRDAFCRHNPKSAYAISSFRPTGYQPAMMITGSHAF